MKEFENIFQEAVNEYVNSGDIQKRIKEKVKQTFDSIIDSAFSWGDLKKNIENVIKEKVKIDPNQVELDTYNIMIENALKDKLLEFKNNEAAANFSKTIDKMFGEAPKEIDIHKLIDSIVEKQKENLYDIESYEEYAEVEKKLDLDSSYQTADFKIKFEYENRYSSGEEVSLHLSRMDKEKDQTWRLSISHKMNINPTALFDVEAYIFQLYAAGTRITGVEEFNGHNCDLLLREEY